MIACTAADRAYSRGEQDETIFGSRSSETYLLGLCTGMLPAAAVAVSSSTSQLLEISPHIVRLSLRLGLEARRRSVQIEGSAESWAILVSGKTPREQQAILDHFHQELVRTRPSFDSWIHD